MFWDEEAGRRTALYDHFVAGVLATTADFTLLYAPNINSYKRFAEGSFAPDTIAWGWTTAPARSAWWARCGRPDGEPGAGRGREPLPRAAAMLAGGLYGVEDELPLEDELVGNAYTSGREKVPNTLAPRGLRQL